tara:strand:- start:1043 stop:1654 length:612 start_codon:yes stop_codon:yes gene_type:complete
MKIMLATKNPGKIKEITKILQGSNIKLFSHKEIEIPEVEETGMTFVENALLKARSSSDVTGLPSIADDSGIEVDYLNAQPGVRSARYSGENATNESNNKKLLEELEGVSFKERTARYRCVIVFTRFKDDPFPLISMGSWEGFIAESPRGSNGFGYDPIFFLPDLGKTSAELTDKEKNLISHRAIALKGIENYFINQHNYKNEI